MPSARKRIFEAALRLFAERGYVELTVTDLAEAAGFARNTVYKNVEKDTLSNTGVLFEEVAKRLCEEMRERLGASLVKVADPALRVSHTIRQFVRRAHDEPLWGRFLVRFTGSSPALGALLRDSVARDILLGGRSKQFDIKPEQARVVTGMAVGAVLAGTVLVLEGHRTWRDAGSETARFFLRALGLDAETAGKIATSDLPPLPHITW